ncbi:MAG: hypothetical protein H8F28_11340 [Fibrella sp.]|nr:hypothetical protein [Armatimonadota bacterium]
MSESADNQSPLDTSPDGTSPQNTLLPPQSQAEWRSRIASAPGKDLLKLVQRDKPRASRLLSGFRATPESVKNPVVLSRVAEEAMKQPGFASELASLPGSIVVSPLAPGSPGIGGRTTAEVSIIESGVPVPVPLELETTAPTTSQKDNRLREQIDKQRAALKEKEERINALERDATQAKRDLAALRTELDTARKAKESAEAESANLRRRAEREAREKGKGNREQGTGEAKPVATPSSPIPYPLSPVPYSLPIEEALRRLLRRGKYVAVAEVCKEAIMGGGIRESPAMARGAVYALYAAALYGSDEAERAADQDSRAVESFLDAGAVVEATESFARLLSQATLLRSTLADDATLLRRLVALAERDNKLPHITAAFLRVRIVSPQGFNLLLGSLQRKVGKRGAEIAASLSATARDQSDASGIGPDEMISLPGTALPPLSPRKLADAAETGESRLVLRVRDVLAGMRYSSDTKQATLADALLSAVGEISRIGVLPYTTAPGFTPRCVIVDASNVARHNPDPLAMDNSPRVASLLMVRDFLFRRDFFPVLLVADATLRFHVDDKAAYLSLVERGIIRETPPGTSADETLIAEARERDATLITNDRLSEWGDAARRIVRLGFTLTPTGVALLPT